MINKIYGLSKLGADATTIKKGKSGARALQNRLAGDGVPSTVRSYTMFGHPIINDTISFPNNNPLVVPNALFRTNRKGNLKTAEMVERETQKARAKHLGEKNYEDGVVYDVPANKFSNWGALYNFVTPNTIGGTFGLYTNRYNVGDSWVTALGLLEKGRAYAPMPVLNGGLYRDSSYGTILHEINHYFTPGIPGSTQSYFNAVNPRLPHGDEATENLYESRNKNAYKYPGYPVDDLPISYYNSLPEAYTAARTLKQYLASNGIPTVGIHPNLRTSNRLSNGTYPFNTAMLYSGIWKLNPKYDFSRRLKPGSKYEPKYLMNPLPEVFPMEPARNYFPRVNKSVSIPTDVTNRINREATEMLKHINLMQYLIDLGDQRTPEQSEELKTLQERIPVIFETANVSNPQSRSNIA